MTNAESPVDHRLNRHERQIWGTVANSPLHSLWHVPGVRVVPMAKRVWQASLEDRLFGHAAELGFYFLFSLFPMLLCASSILGLAARSAYRIYDHLLNYLALVIPHTAFGMVLDTFNQTTAASSSGKITFGLLAAIWSASVGVSAIQDTLNAVYKLEETRSYLRARLAAIALTIVLIASMSLCLACLLGGDALAAWVFHRFSVAWMGATAAAAVRILSWSMAVCCLMLCFALTYYWAPNRPRKRWHWLTPGMVLGVGGWFLASLGFRLYLHFFNSYSVTYGSLGAVMILLMWFYITGLMFLLGAELNSEIEAAAVERELRQQKPPSGASLYHAA